MQNSLLLGIALVKIEAAGRLAGAQVVGQLLQPCGFGGSTLLLPLLAAFAMRPARFCTTSRSDRISS